MHGRRGVGPDDPEFRYLDLAGPEQMSDASAMCL